MINELSKGIQYVYYSGMFKIYEYLLDKHDFSIPVTIALTYKKSETRVKLFKLKQINWEDGE